MFRLIVPLNDDVPSASEMDSETTQKTRVENKNVMVNDRVNVMVNDRVNVMVNDRVNVMVNDRVIEIIKQNPNMNVMEIADAIKKSERQTRRIVSELKKNGILIRVGADKNGHWEIISNEESK